MHAVMTQRTLHIAVAGGCQRAAVNSPLAAHNTTPHFTQLMLCSHAPAVPQPPRTTHHHIQHGFGGVNPHARTTRTLGSTTLLDRVQRHNPGAEADVKHRPACAATTPPAARRRHTSR
jgi:hypothetical protein